MIEQGHRWRVTRDYWLERAAQCRASAASRDDVVRRRLLKFAEAYDALAELAVPVAFDRSEKPKQSPSHIVGGRERPALFGGTLAGASPTAVEPATAS